MSFLSGPFYQSSILHTITFTAYAGYDDGRIQIRILTLDFEDERANINGDYGLANWC